MGSQRLRIDWNIVFFFFFGKELEHSIWTHIKESMGTRQFHRSKLIDLILSVIQIQDANFVTIQKCKQLQLEATGAVYVKFNPMETDGYKIEILSCLSSRKRWANCDRFRGHVGDRITRWDQILSIAEFAYNSSVNRSTSRSIFEIVFGHVAKKTCRSL